MMLSISSNFEHLLYIKYVLVLLINLSVELILIQGEVSCTLLQVADRLLQGWFLERYSFKV